MTRNTDLDADLTIVGGGILGAWALYLAQRRNPDWRIVLVDRFRVGDGATAHSAGVLLATGRSRRERQLAATGAALYRESMAALGHHTSDAEVYWAVDAAHADAMRAAAVGFALEDVAPDAPSLDARLLGPLRLQSGERVLRGGTAVSLDAALVARTLVAAALRSSRVNVVEGTGVAGFQTVAGGVALRLDDGNSLRSARVLVAVGPWLLDPPFHELEPRPAVRLKKVVAIHVHRSPPSDAAALFLPGSDAYLMPLPRRNQWLFSFRAEAWDCAPRKHDLEISAADRELAAELLERYQPGLGVACRGGRVFCDAYTVRGEPLVSVHLDGRLVVAGGGSGAGFRLAPGMADEALALLPSEPSHAAATSVTLHQPH